MAVCKLEIDEHQRKRFEKLELQGKKAFEIGLLIGNDDATLFSSSVQKLSKNNLVSVSTLIPCPKPPNEKVSVPWYTHHAKQVMRMFPGGMQILGMYIWSPNKDVEVAKLVQAVYKTVASAHYPNLKRFVVLLKTDLKSLLEVKLTDTDGGLSKSGVEAIELSYDPNVCSSFSRICCKVSIDSGFFLDNVDKKCDGEALEMRSTQLRKSTGLLCKSLREKIFQSFLVDVESNRVVSDETMIAPGSNVNVILNMELPSPLQGILGRKESTDQSIFFLKGNLECRAQLCGSVSALDVKAALMEDIQRSLSAKIDLLTDDLTDIIEDSSDNNNQLSEQDLEEPVVASLLHGGTVTLPKRIETPMSSDTGTKLGHLCLVDYILADESLADYALRALDMLGHEVSLDEVKIFDESSRVTTPTDMGKTFDLKSKSKPLTESSKEQSVSQKGNSIPSTYLIGLILAIFAVFIAFMSR